MTPPAPPRDPAPSPPRAPRAAAERRQILSSSPAPTLPLLTLLLCTACAPTPTPANANANAGANANASAGANANAPANASAPAPAPASASAPAPAWSPPVSPAPPPDLPQPPPIHPLDPKLNVDSVLFLSLAPTTVWTTGADDGTLVLDRKSGCAIESYANPSHALRKLRDATTDDEVAAELARPKVTDALREVAGLGIRLGASTHPYFWSFVWSPDGRYAYLTSKTEYLYRSDDGARTFKKVDAHRSGRLEMAPDGKHLVYERCAHDHCPQCSSRGCATDRVWVSVPTDASRPPVEIANGHPIFIDFKDATHARFSRDGGGSACLLTVDVTGRSVHNAVCKPIPIQPNGPAPYPRWEAVSPNGAYGLVTWNEHRKNLAGAKALTLVMALVDATNGQVLKTVTDMRGEVDDAGNMVLSAMGEGGGDATYYYPRTGPRRLLGRHSLMTWRDRTAFLGVYRRGPVGARKCAVVKLVPTP